MLAAFILSATLASLCVACHYEMLRALNDRLPEVRFIPARSKVLAALGAALGSHLAQVLLFAAAYFLMRDHFGLGGFGGHFRDRFSSFLYFSTETYTTLGFGDIYPVGDLRMVAGVEALIGLLMVSWTASFTYLEMRRYW